MKSWTIELERDDNGDLILPLSDEILQISGFKVGDDIEWVDNHDGSYTLQKSKDKEWVLVETVMHMRTRYMVQVPHGKPEYALDTVALNEATEFSQKYLGESIVSHRVVSQKDAIEMCDIDNDYASGWPLETKLDTFFTKED